MVIGAATVTRPAPTPSSTRLTISHGAVAAVMPSSVPAQPAKSETRQVRLTPKRPTISAAGNAITIPVTEKSEDSQPPVALERENSAWIASRHGTTLFCKTAMETPQKITESDAVHAAFLS